MPSYFDLATVPSPLTSRQRLIFWTIAFLCAAARFLAMARSLWDWDEALFCLGLRSYDVSLHHPHPPGFPVFMALAKIARLLIHDDFRALQAVSLLSGALLFPAMFLLARELRLRFATSIVAAALCAFFPNVWFFGGAAFSDVPSITLVAVAVAMLFRGCRDANAYLAGSLLLALAIGIRPQNVLVGLFPGALATWYRARESARDVIFAALLGVAIVGVAFGSAIYATGSYKKYVDTVRAHSEYIARIDSFRAPARPPLWRLFDRFFIKQYQSPALSVVTSLLVAVSVIGALRTRDRSMLFNFLAFAPFALMAWLMLDRFSINRFSIGYCPMFAIFAADGISRLTRRKAAIESLVGVTLIGAFFFWTLPALEPVRNELSPPVQAALAVRGRLDPKRDQLFVGFSMVPFVEFLDPYVPFLRVMDERAIPMSAGSRRPHLLAEIDATRPHGLVFERERGRLWNITRRHYFVVALEPLSALPQFVSGWYEPEHVGIDEWRWMSGHSVTLLPSASGPMKLRLIADVADELIPMKPTITVTLNGRVVERFTPDLYRVERDWYVLPAASGATNVLEIDINHVVNPAREGRSADARDLGMGVRYLSWGPS